MVTSFRWSVLPQDAERLCVQELVLSPSSSCQDRGVYRKRHSVKWDCSDSLRKQTHILGRDRGSGSCFLLCLLGMEAYSVLLVSSPHCLCLVWPALCSLPLFHSDQDHSYARRSPAVRTSTWGHCNPGALPL